jgi:DNA-binding FadR family transcriptional regulator
VKLANAGIVDGTVAHEAETTKELNLEVKRMKFMIYNHIEHLYEVYERFFGKTNIEPKTILLKATENEKEAIEVLRRYEQNSNQCL